MDGNAPDHHRSALLLVDVINDFEFPGGDRLLAVAVEMALPLCSLLARARQNGVPVIYANDNFGRWQSSLETLVTRCLEPQRDCRKFVEQVAPQPTDYAVLKPKHSAFYQTPLDLLLKHLGTERLILAGFCTDSCILFTAHDGYMRDLHLLVASDCVGTQSEEDHQTALEHMQTVTKAEVLPSAQITF